MVPPLSLYLSISLSRALSLSLDISGYVSISLSLSSLPLSPSLYLWPAFSVALIRALFNNHHAAQRCQGWQAVRVGFELRVWGFCDASWLSALGPLRPGDEPFALHAPRDRVLC